MRSFVAPTGMLAVIVNKIIFKMTDEINLFLEKLDTDWNPLKKQALKYFDQDSKIRPDGALQIYRRFWIAPQNYAILIFPPAEKLWFEKFYERTGFEIPNLYKEILLKVNGFFVYDFDLFGLPKSIYETGLLERLTLQQFSLESANIYWKTNYKIENKLFHIGSGRYSDDENLGYFIDGEKILSIRENGEILNSWNSVKKFLSEEIEKEENNMLNEKSKL